MVGQEMNWIFFVVFNLFTMGVYTDIRHGLCMTKSSALTQYLVGL
jgi:hypothetical protein